MPPKRHITAFVVMTNGTNCVSKGPKQGDFILSILQWLCPLSMTSAWSKEMAWFYIILNPHPVDNDTDIISARIHLSFSEIPGAAHRGYGIDWPDEQVIHIEKYEAPICRVRWFQKSGQWELKAVRSNNQGWQKKMMSRSLDVKRSEGAIIRAIVAPFSSIERGLISTNI